jgi:hypothetical protein
MAQAAEGTIPTEVSLKFFRFSIANLMTLVAIVAVDVARAGRDHHPGHLADGQSSGNPVLFQ